MTSDLLDAEGTDVRWDPQGTPRKISGDFELPAGGDAAQGPALNDALPPDVVSRVEQFLKEHAVDFALPPSSAVELMHRREIPGRQILKYQETVDGVPVFDGTVTVQLGEDKRIKQIDIERPSGSTELRAADAAAVPAPVLPPSEALDKAREAVGSPELRLTMPAPRLVYFPREDGLRLAYEVLLATKDPHDWRLVVDAQDGALLYKNDKIKHVEGRGLVFDPNPVVTKRDTTLRDPGAVSATCGFAGTDRATIDQQRVDRILLGLTVTGGQHHLTGPFATITNFAAPDTAIPTEADPLAFNYSSANTNFHAVNVYYHVDTIQRYVQSLGITTVNNRSMLCDPYDNSLQAAWYSPFDKGLHFYDSGPCRPHRAEDGECILHEYGHAMQDDQVPGWGERSPITGRDETGAMGEGFGDALACIYFAVEQPFQAEVFEDWVFGDRPSGGLRRVDGTKTYPGDWVGEVHDDGEIWGSALWEIFVATGGTAATVEERRAARDGLLKALILSHFLVPKNGTFEDGAAALLTTYAEEPGHNADHLATMQMVFKRRGVLTGGLVDA